MFITTFLSNDLYTMSTILNFANANFLFIGIAKHCVILFSLAINDTFFFVILLVNLINTGEWHSVIGDSVSQMLHITFSSSETNSCSQFGHWIFELEFYISVTLSKSLLPPSFAFYPSISPFLRWHLKERMNMYYLV